MNSFSRRLMLVICYCLSVGVATAHADSYVVDDKHTSIIFGISHLGYSYTYGRFNKVKGGYVLDQANPAKSQFQLAIDPASVDTNDQDRDKHLRGPDFFDAKQFKTINFQSTSVSVKETETGLNYTVDGNLTLHGVTKPIRLNVQKIGEGKGPYGNHRTGFLCQTSIKRSDYGMTEMLPMIGDEVAITISFEGLRQENAAGSGSAANGATEASGNKNIQPAPAAGPSSSPQQGSGSAGK